MNANIFEKSQQSPNWVRFNQETPSVNSLVINTNDATKGNVMKAKNTPQQAL